MGLTVPFMSLSHDNIKNVKACCILLLNELIFSIFIDLFNPCSFLHFLQLDNKRLYSLKKICRINMVNVYNPLLILH